MTTTRHHQHGQARGFGDRGHLDSTKLGGHRVAKVLSSGEAMGGRSVWTPFRSCSPYPLAQ